MIERKRNETGESEAAYALSMVLVNMLLLAVVAALLWFLFFVVNESYSLNAIVHGGFLP